MSRTTLTSTRARASGEENDSFDDLLTGDVDLDQRFDTGFSGVEDDQIDDLIGRLKALRDALQMPGIGSTLH